MEQLIKNIGLQLHEFFGGHTGETFCTLAVDAGAIALNTVEHFDRKIADSRDSWEKSCLPVGLEQVLDLDRKALRAFPYFSRRMKKGDTMEQALEAENDARREKRSDGNPYDDPKSDNVVRLRSGPGNFAYTEVVDLNLDDEYFEHYDLDHAAQGKSRYQAKITLLLAELEKNKESVLRGATLSGDFFMFAAEHEH